MKEDVHVLTISGKVSTTKNKISKLANKRHRQSLILPTIILLTTHPQLKVTILLQRRRIKLLFRSIKRFNSRQNKWTQVSQNLGSIKWICRLRIYPPLWSQSLLHSLHRTNLKLNFRRKKKHYLSMTGGKTHQICIINLTLFWCRALMAKARYWSKYRWKRQNLSWSLLLRSNRQGSRLLVLTRNHWLSHKKKGKLFPRKFKKHNYNLMRTQ